MKPTELRIGNLVEIYHASDVICEVSSIHSDSTNSTIRIFNKDKTDTCGCFALRIFKPIPLTEEWLLNFGFYKNIDTELFEKGGFQIEISVLKCLFYLPEFGDWHKEIEYVHQLQNLWFALTSEELTL